MILKHVHLFGILLLSLLLASFLGKFLDINNTNNNKEGIDGGGDDEEAPMNRHTGGTAVDRAQEQDQMSADDETESAAPESIFGGAFDTVLPSERHGNGIESFIAPFIGGGREGLANGSPTGIPSDQIPPGQEHLYVLKSQVVPPTTCPVCPNAGTAVGSTSGGGSTGGENSLRDSSSGLSNGLGSAFGGSGSNLGSTDSGESKCPPCPACARCPEPSFDCKKVPNYSIGQNGSLSVPRPVLADFSQFGM